MNKTWGTDKAYIGVAPWHLRVGFFDRVALIVGDTGGYFVVGAMYDRKEGCVLIGIPGLVVGFYV